MIDLNKNRNDLTILNNINALNITKKEYIKKAKEMNERIIDFQNLCKHLLVFKEYNNESQEYNGYRCLICDKFSKYDLAEKESIVLNVSDYSDFNRYSLNYNEKEHLQFSNKYFIRARLKIEEILKSTEIYSLDETKELLIEDINLYKQENKNKKLLKRNDENE